VEKPLVSVLTCAYNALPYLRDAIDSVRSQTYQNWELLICDDASIDGTRAFLDTVSDPRIKTFANTTNRGYLYTKNKLHQLASGAFLTQLDADDVYGPNKLELQVRAAIGMQASIVGCGYATIDTKARIGSAFSVPEDSFLTDPLSVGNLPFWFPSLLVERSVFANIGLFDEYFTGAFGDDLYWAIRAAEHYEFYCISSVQYFYRYTPGSITNSLTVGRKAIITLVVSELASQRSLLGTDWLEQREYERLHRYERSLLEDRELMHNRLLTFAAKHVDHAEFSSAMRVLFKACRHRLFSERSLRVAFYMFRKYLLVTIRSFSCWLSQSTR